MEGYTPDFSPNVEGVEGLPPAGEACAREQTAKRTPVHSCEEPRIRGDGARPAADLAAGWPSPRSRSTPRAIELARLEGRAMFGTSSLSSGPGRWRSRWNAVRDLLGGVLVLVVWVALWTSVWAAVSGPLSPVGRERAAEVELRDAG